MIIKSKGVKYDVSGLINARDYLRDEFGFDCDKTRNLLSEWKRTYSENVLSIRGRYGGTFLSDQQKKSLVSYIEKNDYRARIYGQRENLVLIGVEAVIGRKLERQFKVGKYSIDGYDRQSNTAYEVDEAQHKKKAKIKEDKERQDFISDLIGCKFVRIEI